METLATTVPKKWGDIFADKLDETQPEAKQTDGVAAGILLWMCLDVADRLYLLRYARNVRKCEAND